MLEEPLSPTASSTLSLSTRSYELTTISSPTSTSTFAKRALTPETLTNTPRKLGSTDSLNSSESIIDLETSTSTPSGFQTEEIDLATPKVNIFSARWMSNDIPYYWKCKSIFYVSINSKILGLKILEVMQSKGKKESEINCNKVRDEQDRS